MVDPHPAPLAPAVRLTSSRRKIRPPFELDPTLCLYSPQSNLDALTHPRVVSWLTGTLPGWTPTPVPGSGPHRMALLLPCTKYKPYPTSREHRAVNAALLAAGWRPAGPSTAPAELQEVLDPGEDPEVLTTAPLVRDGVVLDRFVISEPLAVVPYELTMYLGTEQSPATGYDDPGLFAGRGTSVSPERADCTAVRQPDGRWTWGPAERAAYAAVHNAMADVLTTTLTRLAGHYRAILAWVSPGLTHRSFLAADGLRRVEGIPRSMRGPDGPLPLHGVLDQAPGLLEIMPTPEQLDRARTALRDRLVAEGRPHGPTSVRAVLARGDGHDTPLGLPELAAELVAALDRELDRDPVAQLTAGPVGR